MSPALFTKHRKNSLFKPKKETIAKRITGWEGLFSRIEERSLSAESDESLALKEIGKNSNKRKVNKTLPLKTKSSKSKSEAPKMVRKKVNKTFPQETRETVEIINATSKSKVKTNLNLSQKSIGINKQPNRLIEGNSLNSKFNTEKQTDRNRGKENEPVSLGNKSNKSKSKAPKTVKAKVNQTFSQQPEKTVKAKVNQTFSQQPLKNKNSENQVKTNLSLSQKSITIKKQNNLKSASKTIIYKIEMILKSDLKDKLITMVTKNCITTKKAIVKEMESLHKCIPYEDINDYIFTVLTANNRVANDNKICTRVRRSTVCKCCL